ncbi:MAG: GNAT family N-acetyltransferase, partial [Spirochaetaceae bacterium]|nr:GNAT family N-acetyltransferase [Spirochaetaceae bacterium]
FCGQTEFYIPAFLYRFLKNIHIHALHGLKQETETLEEILKPIGIYAQKRHDYNLMSIENTSQVGAVKIPNGLTLRRAVFDDIDELTPLQEAYQKEEVLRNPNDYNRRVCRLGLKKQIAHDKTLVAVIDGKIAGKINTNAFAYNNYQIGGVYVLPEYRGRGIAGGMTAAFTRLLLSEGKGVSLFVKKDNKPAERIYKQCGFKKIADYRIVYMC